MWEKLKSWWKNLWKKHVEGPKSRASIKREQTIAQAPRSKQRAQTKLIAYETAREYPARTPAEKIAPEVAQKLRSLKASGQLQKEVQKAGKTLPKPTQRQIRPITGEKRNSLLAKAWRVFDWFDTNVLRRVSLPFEAAIEAQNIEAKKVGTKWSMRPFKAGARAFKEAILHPEQARKKYPGVDSLKYLPLEIFLDPFRFSKVVKVVKVVKGVRGLSKALKAEEEIQKALKQMGRLEQTIRRAGQRKAAAEQAIKDLRSEAKVAEKFLTKQYTKARATAEQKLQKAIEAATKGVQQKARAQVARLQKQIATANKRVVQARQSLDRATEAYSRLAASIKGKSKVPADIQTRLQKALQTVRDRQAKLAAAENVLQKRRAALADALQSFRKEQQAAREAVQKAREELAGVEKRRVAAEAVLANLRKLEQQAMRSERQAQRATRSMQDLARQIEEMHTGGEWRLRLGPVSVPLSPVGRAFAGAGREVISRIPGVREVVTFLGRAFRPESVAYLPGRTAEEAEELSRVKRVTLDWLRRAGREVSAAARRTLEERAGMGIPREAWKQASHYVEAAQQGTAARRAFLDSLPPELRQPVRQAAKVWQASEKDMQRMLEQAFGPEMVEFFGKSPEAVEEGWRFFLEGYVPHIVTDPPEKVKQVVAKNWQLIARTMPGAKPGFTRARIVDTIQQLKDLGLHPIEDLDALEAIHRGQVESLIQLKYMTDYLKARGYIRPASELGARAAVEGWQDVSKVFPWLRGYVAHPEIAHALSEMRPLITTDSEALKALGRAHRAVMNVFRPLVTTIRPSFHIGNISGNIWLSMMAGMRPDEIGKNLAKAVRILISPKTDEERAVLDLFRRYGLEGQGIFREMVQAPEQVAKDLEKYLERIGAHGVGKIKAVLLPKGGIPGVEALRQLGQATDSVFRLGAFLHFLEKGHSPIEAAQLVKRYFFDYGALSRFERDVMRNVFPFYGWMRYAATRALLGPIEHPYAVSTFMRLQQRTAEKEGVNMDELPYWMQDALILDAGEDGKIVYLPMQPPWQTATRIVGAGIEEGPEAAVEEVASNVSPVIQALSILAGGKDVSGRTKADTLGQRVVEALKQFFPAWEMESALRLPTYSDRPRTTSTPIPFLPLREYDKPYAEAAEVKRAEQVLRDYLSQLKEEEGIEVPEIKQVEKEIRQLDKAAMATAVLQDISKNGWKTRFILAIAGGDIGKGLDIATKYPELFYGSDEEVKERFRKVLTLENMIKLRVSLGRPITFMDIIENYNKLAKGNVEAVTPQQRKLQDILNRLSLMRRAQQSGGTAALPQPISVPTNRRLTDEEAVAVLQQAVQLTGVPQEWLGYLLWLARRESNLNPRAYNTDSGASGLMQMLPSTFQKYAAPGMTDIFNPLHNAVAAIRYIKARYGDPSRIPNIGNWKAYRGY